MSTLYVRKTGNDTTGDGTTGTPYLTINKAMTVAVAGDLILVGDGTYAETSGSGYLSVSGAMGSRTTVAPESGLPDKVIVSGTGTAWGVIFGNATNWHFDQLTFRAQANTVNAPIRFAGTAASGIAFTRCRFQGWSASGQTNGCVTTAWTTPSSTNSTHTFSLCTFEQIGVYPAYGMVLDNAGSGSTATGMEVLNCTFSVGYYGLRLMGLTDVEVHGNVVDSWAPSASGHAFQLGADATTGAACSGNVSGNTFRARNSHAAVLGAGCNGVLFAENKVYGGADATLGQGLVLKDCQNVRAERNTIFGGYLSSLYFKAANNCQAFENLVMNRYATSPALRVAVDGANTCSGLTVRRNTFQGRIGPMIDVSVSGDVGGSTYDENVYAPTGSGTLGTVRGTSVSTITGLRAAWSTYDHPNNDRNSRLGVKHPPHAGSPMFVLP